MLEIPRAGYLFAAIVFDNVPWARQLLSEDPGVVHEFLRRDLTPQLFAQSAEMRGLLEDFGLPQGVLNKYGHDANYLLSYVNYARRRITFLSMQSAPRVA